MIYAHVARDGTINPETVSTNETTSKLKALIAVYGAQVRGGMPDDTVIAAIYAQQSTEDGGKIRPVTITLARFH